ncbi:hypothetical protein Tco_0974712 [Tanacetum coccineum]|uniref:Uncharacterized protein n=1 Tax=Tanacetum coccineum TaxID=301880 RepID=A0ABQ5ECE0_9ASTR
MKTKCTLGADMKTKRILWRCVALRVAVVVVSRRWWRQSFKVVAVESGREDGDNVVAWFDGRDDGGVVAAVSWSGSQGGGAEKDGVVVGSVDVAWGGIEVADAAVVGRNLAGKGGAAPE